MRRLLERVRAWFRPSGSPEGVVKLTLNADFKMGDGR